MKPGTAGTSANAGRAIPMKFSLHGNKGLNILAAGSPASVQVDCRTTAPTGAAALATTSGAPELTYDAASDTYSYVWKTDKRWAGTCRQFRLTLSDGSTHVALFDFR